MIALFAQGDKFNSDNLENLTAYLPALPSTPDASTPEQSDAIPLIGIEDSLTGLYILVNAPRSVR